MKPLVTVITPVYNRKQYIEETIESVLSQNYPKLEYIVLNDGSTDDTLAVVKRYDGRLYWESHPNMGETRTVNRGFELARGDIVGVVNSDDPLLPGAIARIMKEFEENPGVDVIYPDWNLIDQAGEVVFLNRTRDYSFADMYRLQACIPGPAAFFRRTVFEKLEGRNPSYRFVADFDYWLRAGLEFNFKRLPEVLATFRVHPDSISVSQRNREMAQEHIKLVEDFYGSHKDNNTVKRFKRQAFSSAYFESGAITIRQSILLGMAQFLISTSFLLPFEIFKKPYISRCKEIVAIVLAAVKSKFIFER